MPKLIIKRTSELNNRMRDFGIYLNGKKIGVIGNGETQEYEIDPGNHTLKSKIDWCGSEELKIQLKEDETKIINLSGFKFGGILMPVALFISVFYFLLGNNFIFSPLIFLLIMTPFVLYPMYYLTIGRNKYLNLKEK